MAYKILKTTLYENEDREIDVPVDFRNKAGDLVLTGTLAEARKGMTELKRMHNGNIIKINSREFGVVGEYSTVCYSMRELG